MTRPSRAYSSRNQRATTWVSNYSIQFDLFVQVYKRVKDFYKNMHTSKTTWLILEELKDARSNIIYKQTKMDLLKNFTFTFFT